MDYMALVNLIFCATIVTLSLKEYKNTAGKAFLFVALGFLMFGISHFSLLMGWGKTLKTILIVVRSFGYILNILALVI